MKTWLSKIDFSQLVDALLPVFATFAALALGAVMLLVLGANPIRAYGALVEGAFGSGNAIAETAVKAVPLLLVALASASRLGRMSSTSAAKGR